MPHELPNERQQTHELIERLPPSQLTAVVGLLEAMLDPVSRAIAQAPLDDEPVTEEERQALARSEAWFEERGGKGVPMEEVLADFGLTMEDLAEKHGPQH
ncbi:MAG: hypothetical protein ACRD1N_08470 [Terriglobia bacterium]